MINKKEKYKTLLQSNEWKEKRMIILKRDGFKCRFCDNKRKLQVHHKIYIYGKNPWEYNDSQLITLCCSCHEKEHEIKKIKVKNKPKKKSKMKRIDKLIKKLSPKDRKLQKKYDSIKA